MEERAQITTGQIATHNRRDERNVSPPTGGLPVRTNLRMPRGYPALVMDKVMFEFEKKRNDVLKPINFCQAGSSFNPFDHVDVAFSRTALGKHTAYTNVNGQMSLRKALSR